MPLWNQIYMAVWSITTRPIRSCLMALTLGAGAGSVALATAILAGYGQQMERMVFGAYARSLVITENTLIHDRFGPPRVSDLEALDQELGTLVEARAAWRTGFAEAQGDGDRYEVRLFGVVGDYQREANMAVAHGRAFTRAELAGAERQCMLGASAAARLFARPADAVGAPVRINGISCAVIGVFGPAETNTAERYALGVLLPFTAMVRYFDRSAHLAPDEANQLTVVLLVRRSISAARETADRILRREHGAPLSHAAPFRFGDENASLRAMNRQRDLLTRLLFSIATISMIAAAIGYGGYTLSAVETRRRDIALQMACGALGSDILFQFMLESLILGVLGAAIGAGVAAGLGFLVSSLWDIPVALDPCLALAALAGSIGAGVAAGALPASRAAAAAPALAVKG